MLVTTLKVSNLASIKFRDFATFEENREIKDPWNLPDRCVCPPVRPSSSSAFFSGMEH